MVKVQIRHPDHLEASQRRLEQAFSLYKAGRIPKRIEGWMLIVPVRGMLRAIYGSDLRAAVALLGHAFSEMRIGLAARARQKAYTLSYALAHVWTWSWGLCRYLSPGRAVPWRMCFMWGRWESPEPIKCDLCAWAGPRRWAVHDYTDDGAGDVEPVDNCPACGAEV